MVAPSASIELYIDGTRVPSTPGELAGGVVTALDNLRLTWGRDGQNEQPGPASVVCELVDPAGADDVLDLVHVGSSVAVWAEGEIPAGGGATWVQTYDDGTLESWPLGPASSLVAMTLGPLAGTVFDVVDRGDGHGHTLRATQTTATSGGSVTVHPFATPPRPFTPTADLPNAWDDIPRRSPGDPGWLIQFDVWAPAGVTVTPGVARYTTPYPPTGYGGVQTFPQYAVTPGGAWRRVAFTFAANLTEPAWLAAAATATGLKPYTWAGAVGTWADHPETWESLLLPAIYVDNILVGPPGSAATTRRVLVFSGEISDLRMSPWGDRHSTGLTVTAVDIGGRLGNTVVGDEPWPVHTVAVRADRIAQLAGITTVPRVRIDTGLDVLQLSARDVDAQPAYQLLQDLAQSAGGVLWAATHAVTGPFLWIENPANRAAVQQLVETGGIIVITGGATGGVSILSACDLLEDGVTWAQDTGDVATVVAVTWAEQGVDDDGQPTTTDRTVTVSADAATITRYGTRRLSISTELIAEADAAAYASRVLAQARAVAWRLDGLTLDTGAGLSDTLASVDDASRQTALLDLLDGTTRMGAALTLVDMPAYAPRGAISSVYVDGGTYTYAGDAWSLALATTPAAGQGSSVTWAQLAATHPTWTWAQIAPSTQWQDLYGVTV